MATHQFDTTTAPTSQPAASRYAPDSHHAAPDSASHGLGRHVDCGAAPMPPSIQAAALSRSSGGHLALAGAALLRLQCLHGNRYVQQVMRHAHAHESATAAPRRCDSGGQPLPAGVLTKMGSAFSADFSAVRIHQDTGAQSWGALAYTRGNHIHFAPGRYDPISLSGQRLLGHELTHVVQQRAGRVSMPQRKAAALCVHRALEKEADEMGERAASGEPASVEGATVGDCAASHGVIQPKLGFELELLVLVDIDGRPVPEKHFLGRYGTQNLELQVDHNGDVEGPTPRSAASAGFDVAHTLPAIGHGGPPPPGTMMHYGAYDLPARWETHVGVPPGGAPVADPRTGGGLNFNLLDVAHWNTTTSGPAYTRPPAANNTGLNNTYLPMLDTAIARYSAESQNWEPGRASAQLNLIATAATQWLAVNNQPPSSLWHPHRRQRYLAARNTVQNLRIEAQQHRLFWQAPGNQSSPVGMERLYRDPTSADPAEQQWSPHHPVAGAGGERYASILEIVTRPYEPETRAGRRGIIRAMTEAAQLAQAIEAATSNLTRRARFDTIPNATVLNPLTHIGNDSPGQLRNPQRTDASIQSTFAVDLSQIPSLMLSTVAMMNRQSQFGLKHQADVVATVNNPDTINRAEVEMSRAAFNATNVIRDVQARIGGGAPSFVNLRGLVTLICQYLRLGRYWQPDGVQVLDKNLTDLLSRTDLAHIFRDAVPALEKVWIQAAPANLNFLIGRIFHYTGRAQASMLLNNFAQNLPAGPRHFGLRCDRFVSRVFTRTNDGITRHLGGFMQRPVEDIDPTGTRRAGDTTTAVSGHRQAPVFELRNMMPKLQGDRFPRTDWVALATFMANLINLLNRRTEVRAVRDVRVHEHLGGGAGPMGAGPRLPRW